MNGAVYDGIDTANARPADAMSADTVSMSGDGGVASGSTARRRTAAAAAAAAVASLTSLLDGVAHGVGAHLLGLGVIEGPAIGAPDRGAGGRDDDGFTGHVFLS